MIIDQNLESSPGVATSSKILPATESSPKLQVYHDQSKSVQKESASNFSKPITRIKIFWRITGNTKGSRNTMMVKK